MIKTAIFSSLHKIFPDDCPTCTKNEFSCLINEPLSFQAAFMSDSDDQTPVGFNLRIETDLPVSLYYVAPVPVLYHRDEPHTLFPDVLIPKKVNPTLKNEGYFWQDIWFEEGENKALFALKESWQSVWITVNENGKSVPAGKHKIALSFLNSYNCEEIAREEIIVEVINCKLPPQKVICTNWFHGDCLCDAHGIEPESDDFFTAVYNYARKAALNGQNMMFTPCFTPALDTYVGGERKTMQLVGIKALGKGKYEFDFSLLKRFIDTCKKAGIKYFEHPHLFTQWGATSAPKIIADVNGHTKRIFGWDTPADGAAYRKFLKAYLPAVCDFFKKEGLQKRVLFHISDEPSDKMVATFSAALDAVGDMLDGFAVGDALSHYELYEKGLVKLPIVSTDFIEDFAGKCKNYWCYYTGGQIKEKMSNRTHIISAERNRMIGVQMYAYGIKGYLHWGYNYYYDRLSHGYTDPRLQPGVYLMSCGTSYLVYPADGLDCYQSARQKVFGEGMIDIRALEALEKLVGQDKIIDLCEKHFGKISFTNGPDTPEQYIAFRDAVNDAIKQAL